MEHTIRDVSVSFPRIDFFLRLYAFRFLGLFFGLFAFSLLFSLGDGEPLNRQ